MLKEFTASRRSALAEILERARENGAMTGEPGLVLDRALGVLWYRVLFEHGDFSEHTAERLAGALARNVAT